MTLWDEETAAEATDGKVQGRWKASRIEIDSRRVKPGDLFVALKGENFDGHEFVADAFAKGAAAAVVSRSVPGKALLIVPDTQKALEDLGSYARGRSKAKIVGVTGSVGKTSTKEMLALALSAHGETYATTGNYNNHIGTPLNLANLKPETPFAVFEMGMNHAGEISHLTRMVRPHVAVITNVEAVHLEFFASVEGIADAKAEIFEGVEPNGTAVLNADNAQFARLSAAAKKHRLRVVACGGGARGGDLRLVSVDGGNIVAETGSKKITYTLGAVGRHWAAGSLFALAVAQAFHLDVEKTAAALAKFREPEGRGRVLPIALSGKHVSLIDDSYNASPASMKAAFAKTDEVWKSKGTHGRKVAVLGDMLELGPQSEELHVSLAEELVHCGFHAVFTAGARMKALHDALPKAMRAGHLGQAMELLPLLAKELQESDILLVKGSHGSHMYKLAAALQEEGTKKHAV